MKVIIVYPKNVIDASSVEMASFQNSLNDVKGSDFVAVSPNALMFGYNLSGISGSMRLQDPISVDKCKLLVDSILSVFADELPDYDCRNYETTLSVS